MAWSVTKHIARTVSCFIRIEINSHFGKPKWLITDRGAEMVSNSLNMYCSQKYVDPEVTTMYYLRPITGSNNLMGP